MIYLFTFHFQENTIEEIHLADGFRTFIALFTINAAFAEGVVIRQKLSSVTIQNRGQMVVESVVVDDIMVLKGRTGISNETFNSDDLSGKISTVYHMAARAGIEDINQAFIGGLIVAEPPGFTADGSYKTTTLLNTDDAMWGTSGVGTGRLEKRQREIASTVTLIEKHLAFKAYWI